MILDDEWVKAALRDSRAATGCTEQHMNNRQWGFCCQYHDGMLDGLLVAQEEWEKG